MDTNQPEILAPAGDADCFLAALAAGADGIYLGLKNFSARMEAKNFGLGELARLIDLAHAHSCRVYVAMNNMLKENELEQAYRLVRRLAGQAGPDGLIVQDLAMPELARQAGFKGRIAFSTLANISDAAGLKTAKDLGASRVILPRELSIDEMKRLGAACPEGLELECFVHGALCYCVSGRCYWSSYLGGKSGLRGRCVQPCRRVYGRGAQGEGAKGGKKPAGERYFACQDLELAPVIKALLTVPHLASWKIEGRKKGPHYVYHAVTAYRILRDDAGNAARRKMAVEILELALGRPGVRARFLPQRQTHPMAPRGQTSSGRLAGKVNVQANGKCALRPHYELLPRDLLRIGVEDERWHMILPVSCRVPKGGTLPLKIPAHKTPKAGTPVYLIDRREPELAQILRAWKDRLAQIEARPVRAAEGSLRLPAACQAGQRPDVAVMDKFMPGKWQIPAVLGKRALAGYWLSPRCLEISRTLYDRVSFWLPPAIWPENEDKLTGLIAKLWKNGARHFVCNAPWQRACFPAQLPSNADLAAGPFCNTANALALAALKSLGFAAAFASPELPAREMLALPKASPLPLGAVIGGFWPVGISRFGLEGLQAGELFTSPHGEQFFSRERGGMIWIFPAWPLDLAQKKAELLAAGYSFFAFMGETRPRQLPRLARPGLFNWDGALV